MRTAKAAALTTVPSGLWRVAAAFGVPVGFSGDNAMADVSFGSWFSLYMIALSVFAECLGLLSLGLVQRWGEVFPRWLPFIGGRRVPVWFAVTSAGLGSLALMCLTVNGAFHWNAPDTMGAPESPKGTAALVMGVCYAPLLLWGPLLAVVTVAYAIRRRPRA
ncbi:hypothetical protein WEB32_01460 [Streptomyces netropsis]|uniref:Uncharacterized protein n=1 Tax=Streptomyces netropsis TaxID=55404 RepID=A0A7W7LEJ4_STRNE|nr:hypothetical protein [Streptomyces netropsis]MBB4888191.1 hypothetical protein [Streptomyces netropsis]GGR31377.1 hypothetical protein GCM10010219_40080 [Streptomyces netropsis]